MLKRNGPLVLRVDLCPSLPGSLAGVHLWRGQVVLPASQGGRGGRAQV